MVVLAILFPLVTFLFPLTIYLLILGMVHRRRTPLIVSGPWDFAGVLFAASGFLLVGGPSILTSLGDRWRLLRMSGVLRGRMGDEDWILWILVWGLYFFIVVGGSILLLQRRRKVTSIYNVEPAVLEQMLARVLDSLALSWMRSGNHYAIRPGTSLSTSGAFAVEPAARRPIDVELVHAADPDVPAPAIDLDGWALMRHVNLIWSGDCKELRRQVEAELEKELAQVEIDESPVAGWFLSLTAVSFCLMFGILLLLLLASILVQR